MFKLKNLIVPCLMAMVCGAGFTACSSDDDEGTPGVSLQEEPMAAHAAKFEVKSANSQYESFEFLGDGTYIITNKTSRPRSAQKVLEINSIKDIATLFKNPVKQTRAGYATVHVFGNYTVTADGEYVLENFGTVSVLDGSTIELTYENGLTSTVTVEKVDLVYGGQNTKYLCRTWSFYQQDMDYWVSGQHLFGIAINLHKEKAYFTYVHPALKNDVPDADELFGDFSNKNEMPKRVIFSPSGTYMVETYGGMVGVSSWKWGNEAAGVIYYNWEEDGSTDGIEGQGYANVKFYSNKIQIIEDYKQGDERIKMVSTLIAE